MLEEAAAATFVAAWVVQLAATFRCLWWQRQHLAVSVPGTDDVASLARLGLGWHPAIHQYVTRRRREARTDDALPSDALVGPWYSHRRLGPASSFDGPFADRAAAEATATSGGPQVPMRTVVTARQRDALCWLDAIGPTVLPDVAVLKPCKGDDARLVANLRTFFELEYPLYHLVFCVQDRADPAVIKIKGLMAEFPLVNARLEVGQLDFDVNPKLNNIVSAYEAVTAELVWVCDSGTPAHPSLLTESVTAVRRAEHGTTASGSPTGTGTKIGVLHQLPTLAQSETLGDRVEQMHFGTGHSKYYFVLNMVGFNCLNGMSTLFPKAAMEKIGGLRQFGKYLGEDYYIGKAMIKAGYKLEIGPHPAAQLLPARKLDEVYMRHMRWSRLRRKMLPAASIAEPMLECLPAGALGAHALAARGTVPGWSWVPFLALHIVLWIVCDLLLFHGTIRRRFDPRDMPRWLAAWVLRELGNLAVAAHGALSDEVTWRDRTFVLLKDGLTREKFFRKIM